VTLTDRDRKIMIFIVPAVIAVAYWFVLLSPVRSEGSKLGDDLAKQQQTRDQLKAQVAQLGQARNDFATDYAAVVELGKAVPSTVDMPSLIVQLSKASHGTGINFERISAGPRQTAAAPSATTGSTPPAAGGSTASASSSSSSSAPSTKTPAAAAGGAAASSAPGKTVEKANDTKASQDQAAGATSGAPAAGAAGAAGSSGVAGLDSVPLQFTFRGDFFNLADFFHRMKRFVHVVNGRVDVQGRLMTVDSVDFKTKAFPSIEAQVNANVYLTPKSEGTTAGANAGGPADASAGSAPAASPAPSASPPAAVISR
jgi:hypothetical protein